MSFNTEMNLFYQEMYLSAWAYNNLADVFASKNRLFISFTSSIEIFNLPRVYARIIDGVINWTI